MKRLNKELKRRNAARPPQRRSRLCEPREWEVRFLTTAPWWYGKRRGLLCLQRRLAL